jgi:hypothetical protein
MSAVLYGRIVAVIEDYLGPATQRFVDRQIEYHLSKSPHEISTSDIDDLSDWIRVSMSLLTEDRQTVEECFNKLRQLKEVQE